MSSGCQAPHRLPDNYYDRFENLSPEEGAVTLIAEVFANDYDCGDPAICTVQYRTLPVCQYHKDFFDRYIAPREIRN